MWHIECVKLDVHAFVSFFAFPRGKTSADFGHGLCMLHIGDSVTFVSLLSIACSEVDQIVVLTIISKFLLDLLCSYGTFHRLLEVGWADPVLSWFP